MKRLLLALALLLAACGPAALKEGDIVDKRYTAAYDWMMMIPQYTTSCVTVGTTVSCTQTFAYFLYIPMHEPAHWFITISGCDEDSCRQSEIQVSEEDYLTHDIGDHWRSA